MQGNAAVLLGVLIFISLSAFASWGESQHLYPVFRKGKFGYADKTGKIVIKPAFTEAYGFHEGLASVVPEDINALYNPYEFIAANGNPAFDLKFLVPSHFSEGLCLVGHFDSVAKEVRVGFIDVKGNVAIDLNYREADDFHEGLAAVCLEQGNWFYIDREGRKVKELSGPFRRAGSFGDGLAPVVKHDEAFYIHRDGKIAFTLKNVLWGRYESESGRDRSIVTHGVG
jgi:hypothetical protein